MELVRKFPKGALPQPKVPWYEATVAYLLLIPAAITWFITIPLIISYWTCAGADGFCSDEDLLPVEHGLLHRHRRRLRAFHDHRCPAPSLCN